MRLSEWALNPMRSIFIREAQRRDTKKRRPVIMEAKKYLEPPEAVRGEEGFSPRPFERSTALQTA